MFAVNARGVVGLGLGGKSRVPRILLGAWLLVLSIGASGCEEDPHDPKTWIGKLDQQEHVDEAVRNLTRLKDPSSIKPLGKVWRTYNKPSKILRAIIAIASDRGEDNTGQPHYENALEFLVETVANYDAGSEVEIGDAVVACDALGQAELAGQANDEVLKTLLAAAEKPLARLSRANVVRIAATRALGYFKNPRAVDVLIKLVSADRETQRIEIFAAAAIALSENGDPKALPDLLTAAFTLPIYGQLRGAITRIGKDAVPAVIEVFRRKNAPIEALAKKDNFEKNAPGQITFKTSLLLADLHATQAMSMLLDRLAQEPIVSYFDQKSGNPGPMDHEGVLRALQTFGDPKAADAVYDYAFSDKVSETKKQLRARAVDVYSWLARDKEALPILSTWLKDDKTVESVWFSSVIAYGRIADQRSETGVLKDIKKDYDKLIATADEKLKKAKSAVDRSSLEAGKRINEQYRNALEDSLNRIAIAVECKSDPMCYAKALDAKDIVMGKPGIPRAERALLELYQMGSKGAPALDKLLERAGSPERIIREGINLALPRIAPAPCSKCATALKGILAVQKDMTTMDALNQDTEVLWHYFLWAGK